MKNNYLKLSLLWILFCFVLSFSHIFRLSLFSPFAHTHKSRTLRSSLLQTETHRHKLRYIHTCNPKRHFLQLTGTSLSLSYFCCSVSLSITLCTFIPVFAAAFGKGREKERATNKQTRKDARRKPGQRCWRMKEHPYFRPRAEPAEWRHWGSRRRDLIITSLVVVSWVAKLRCAQGFGGASMKQIRDARTTVSTRW